MSRNRFTDPRTGVIYDWQTNHSEEESTGKTRNITRTAPTGNVGLVKQQGDDGPLIIRLSGSIFHRAQYQQMWHWFQLSKGQTIYFTDFDNQKYEVQITSFLPKRVRRLSNRKDPSMPYHYYTYTMEMEVYRVIAGDLVGVTP